MIADALKIVAPEIQIGMKIRDGRNIVLNHDGMRQVWGTVAVEFLFEQGIHGNIETKSWQGRLLNSHAAVHAYSDANRTPVPIDIGHLFRFKPDTRSD